MRILPRFAAALLFSEAGSVIGFYAHETLGLSALSRTGPPKDVKKVKWKVNPQDGEDEVTSEITLEELRKNCHQWFFIIMENFPDDYKIVCIDGEELDEAETADLDKLKQQITTRKAELKEEKYDNLQINQDGQVKALVEKMNQLKQKEKPGCLLALKERRAMYNRWAAKAKKKNEIPAALVKAWDARMKCLQELTQFSEGLQKVNEQIQKNLGGTEEINHAKEEKERLEAGMKEASSTLQELDASVDAQMDDAIAKDLFNEELKKAIWNRKKAKEELQNFGSSPDEKNIKDLQDAVEKAERELRKIIMRSIHQPGSAGENDSCSTNKECASGLVCKDGSCQKQPPPLKPRPSLKPLADRRFMDNSQDRDLTDIWGAPVPCISCDFSKQHWCKSTNDAKKGHCKFKANTCDAVGKVRPIDSKVKCGASQRAALPVLVFLLARVLCL